MNQARQLRISASESATSTTGVPSSPTDALLSPISSMLKRKHFQPRQFGAAQGGLEAADLSTQVTPLPETPASVAESAVKESSSASSSQAIPIGASSSNTEPSTSSASLEAKGTDGTGDNN
jgi:hypothetical protein